MTDDPAEDDDEQALAGAAAALRRILLSLPDDSPDFEALRRAVLGDGELSYRAAARRCNTSEATLHRKTKAIRARLKFSCNAAD